MKILVSILYILCVHLVTSELVYEYYQQLITDSVENAQTFQLPKNNAKFAEGSAQTEEPFDLGTYDFIIVGAGSAGSVLATRLSEIKYWKILLLEAGKEENDFSNIPAFFNYLQFSEMNWGYYSTPQSTCCLGMKDKKCIVPRGKALGGSSAINAVTYVRGNAQDYDRWAELGNPNWSYEEVLPYFRKSENSQINGEDNYHGKNGFWNVEYALPTRNIYSTLWNGIGELNGSEIDYNGQQQFGVSKTHLNIKHGKRQSTATAFLDNAQKRSNLDILTESLVTKINIDPETKIAQGVEFVTLNSKFSATATKEVIVSSGAINSPQLLMLSGIGPKDHLDELGINVIEDLPVGENLRDHPLFLGLTFKSNYTAANQKAETLIFDYLLGFGQYTTPGIDGNGFIPRENSYPMVEYLFSPPGGSSGPVAHRVYNFDEELVSNYLQKMNATSDIMIPLVLLHPKSKGRITLKSKDPIDFPNIDLNMFSESEDVDNLIEGIDYILKLSQTEAFKELDATLMDIPICTDFEKLAKEFWDCAIRHMTATLYHPSGTTAMGSDKSSSVVDNNLKVHGIENLRVVDAGVFPSTISGHLNAPTIMVAEKISDVIKSYYQL